MRASSKYFIDRCGKFIEASSMPSRFSNCALLGLISRFNLIRVSAKIIFPVFI